MGGVRITLLRSDPHDYGSTTNIENLINSKIIKNYAILFKINFILKKFNLILLYIFIIHFTFTFKIFHIKFKIKINTDQFSDKNYIKKFFFSSIFIILKFNSIDISL